MSHNLHAMADQDLALAGHTVLSMQGRDAVAFAQAQFMNDVALLGDGQWQWNGWLTPKGRVVALFALLRRDPQTLWLLLADADPATLAAQLQRYVFRSKVALQVRNDLFVHGRFQAPARATGVDAADIDGVIELDVSGDGGPRCLRVGRTQFANADGAASRWRLFDIRHGLPRLPASQADKWTPQQLSLDRLKAYSVKKGCYPGQEIVARTHFLGKAKRGLARLQGDGVSEAGDVFPGDPRDQSAAPVPAIGHIVCAEGDEGLAVMPLDAGDGPFRIGAGPCVRLPLLDGLAR